VPTWSKADYEFFAQVLHNAPTTRVELVYLSNRFGDFFAKDNPRFDWSRWNDAIFQGKLTDRRGAYRGAHWTAETYDMTAKALNGPAFLHTYYGLNVTLSDDTRVALIAAFGAAFERDNSKFDWDRFRRAAGSPYAPRANMDDERVANQIRRIFGEKQALQYLDNRERGAPPMSDEDFERMASTPGGDLPRRHPEVRVRQHARRVK